MGAKNVVILGSTGSIGTQTLEVVAAYPDQFRVLALVAGRNVRLLAEQVQTFKPRFACVDDAKVEASLRAELAGFPVEILSGLEGARVCATIPEAHLVVSAIVGARGLRPTIAAIEAGKTVALANKEVLVAAGQLVMAQARAKGVEVLPIDSEHAALHQCLRSGQNLSEVSKLIITGSGGPFRDTPAAELAQVTRMQALKHPNWVMGEKITIDSATLMNKGLELIEAHHLFGIPTERIEVWIHRQSIVHSMVEFVDGNFVAQMGPPDMRLPLQYCLSYPQRWSADWPKLKMADMQQLTFEKPDLQRFPCLSLAYAAIKKGGTAPAVMNAANEVAVHQFLQGQIKFTDIPTRIEDTLTRVTWIAEPTLEDILAVDAESRSLLLPV